MSAPRALTVFRDSRSEVAELLRTSCAHSETVLPDRRMSSQENHLRHVVVALVGILQSYLTELIEERADQLGDSWESSDLVQKRYISIQTTRRLSHLVD